MIKNVTETPRPVSLATSRPLHTKIPSRALRTTRGILQENALHGPRWPAVSVHDLSGNASNSGKTASGRVSHRYNPGLSLLTSTDDHSPLSELRYTSEVSKLSAKVPLPTQRTRRVTSRPTGVSHAPTSTTPVPNPSKQPVPQFFFFLKRGQAVSTPVARSTGNHPTWPVPATGCIPSTPRGVSASVPHIIPRAATSASFRPMTAIGTVKLPTKPRARRARRH